MKGERAQRESARRNGGLVLLKEGEGLRGVNNKYHARQIAIICGWVLHVAKVIPPP